MSKISIIVAVAENGAIGKDQGLLWRLPNDLKLFKTLTSGHTIIMGRNTFESLPNGALPNRRNIVITSNRDLVYPGVTIAHSLPEAIALCQEEDEAFIIGGSRVYNEALEFADTLYLTRVHHRFEDADTFFPKIDFSVWQMMQKEEHPVDEKHIYPYTFFTFARKKA